MPTKIFQQRSIGLPHQLWRLSASLARRMEQATGHRWRRQDVLREAVKRGLDSLRAQYE